MVNKPLIRPYFMVKDWHWVGAVSWIDHAHKLRPESHRGWIVVADEALMFF